MLRALLLSLALLSITGEAFALTVSWDCNPEPDMKEYRVESSKDAGKSWGIEATWPHPKPCVSPVKMSITRYLAPGERLFRVFGIDTAGNVARQPSEPASYTVKPSPIGNPGGQEEAALPPSPYKDAPVTPPPPVVVLPPPPPPVPKPDAIKNFTVMKGGAAGSVVISLIGPDDGTGKAALINVRTAASGAGWGAMRHLNCTTFPCTVTGIPVGTPQEFQAIPFRSTPQGSVFGDFTPVLTLTLAAPPPPPTFTLKDALAAASKACQAIKTCTAKDFSKALDAQLKKVQP